MRLVGYNDLQARSAYQPTIHKQGDRYIAYIGHHGGTPDVPKPVNPLTGQAEFNGTSIVDVTDPAQPKYLAHIPGQQGQLRGRRRADGARLRRQDAAQGRPPTRSTCCASSAARRTRSGTSPIRAKPGAAHPHRRGPARTRTRAGGNATPASPISFPASTGWRVAAHDRRSTISAIRPSR